MSLAALQNVQCRNTDGALPRHNAFKLPFERLRNTAGTSAEVTELRQAYEAMVRRVEELTRSNAELEQFALRIAHDLRNPLLSLSVSAQLVADEDNKLSERGREAVGYIQGSVWQMNQLISSLLQYSRVGRNHLTKTACPIEEVLSNALRNLRAILESAGAQVTRDPLPTVQADPALISELLQNLIENAVKYRSAAPPQIHVSACRTLDEWVFSVGDNGIGIDPRCFARVFQPFQRLGGGESKYNGVGLGLAICKQIVDRHSGRIWLESGPGRGTTFFFSLPNGTELTDETRLSGQKERRHR